MTLTQQTALQGAPWSKNEKYAFGNNPTKITLEIRKYCNLIFNLNNNLWKICVLKRGILYNPTFSQLNTLSLQETPLSIYQWLVFVKELYMILQKISPSSKRNTWKIEDIRKINDVLKSLKNRKMITTNENVTVFL